MSVSIFGTMLDVLKLFGVGLLCIGLPIICVLYLIAMIVGYIYKKVNGNWPFEEPDQIKKSRIVKKNNRRKKRCRTMKKRR